MYFGDFNSRDMVWFLAYGLSISKLVQDGLCASVVVSRETYDVHVNVFVIYSEEDVWI